MRATLRAISARLVVGHIDPEQGAIYFGTGDATTFPPAPTADSVMALDPKTGKPHWSYQLHCHASYLVGCQDAAEAEEHLGDCPARVLFDGERAVQCEIWDPKNGKLVVDEKNLFM